MRRSLLLMLLPLFGCADDRAAVDASAGPGLDAPARATAAAADTGYVGFDAAGADSLPAAIGTAAGGSPAAADHAAAGAQAAEPEPNPVIDFDRLQPVGPEAYQVGVSAVPESERVRRPQHVRGLYVNSWSAGSTRRLQQLIDLANRTEINAFVVDVKDVTGQVSYESSVPLVERVGANRDIRIGSIRRVLQQLKENDIYPIARIVVFKDPVLARARPDWAIRTADQRVWRDHNDEIWVDSYNRNVWEYNVALAREAIALGFAEVQWDYVRFPDVPARFMRTAVYAAREGRAREDAIRQFLQYSQEQIADAPITADVFGITTSVNHDVGIGQLWEKMSDVTDVLLPMVYPSHYPRGSFGIAHPNSDPYQTLVEALSRGVRRNRSIEDAALIRPWIQDFTLGQPRYGPAYVRAQIQATYDVGLHEWILWNPSSRYTEEALADARGRVPEIDGLDRLVAPTLGEPSDSMPADSLPAKAPVQDKQDLLGRPISGN